MSAHVIDVKAIARGVKTGVAERVSALTARGIRPCLAVVLAGDNPASLSYVKSKQKALEETGMPGRDLRLPADVSEGELLGLIGELNRDSSVHGILVQLPLPAHINEDRVITAISPAKDVDGFHPVSVGNLVIGRPGFLPCTPHGVVYLLKELGIKTQGARAVILGRSNLVGKPLANLLIRREYNATVTVCHTGTQGIAEYCRNADILVAAMGQPGFVTADMVKENAFVIDVGITRVPDLSQPKGYRITGDVDFDAVKEKAAYITPVPGGVGLMTVAMLLRNVAEAAENAAAEQGL